MARGRVPALERLSRVREHDAHRRRRPDACATSPSGFSATAERCCLPSKYAWTSIRASRHLPPPFRVATAQCQCMLVDTVKRGSTRSREEALYVGAECATERLAVLRS